MAPEHGSDQEQLLKKADLALYRSKSAGRNCFTALRRGDVGGTRGPQHARRRLARRHRALSVRGALPAVLRRPDRPTARRWKRWCAGVIRSSGLIPPDQFIPLAEETGLIVPLGEWVIRRACDDAMSWPADIKVAVNLSPVQFKQAELFDMIQSALQEFRPAAGAAGDRDHRIRAAGTRARKPCLHRTAQEHRDFAGARRFRHRIFVARASLTAFPFDKIKIDKSFIANLTQRSQKHGDHLVRS